MKNISTYSFRRKYELRRTFPLTELTFFVRESRATMSSSMTFLPDRSCSATTPKLYMSLAQVSLECVMYSGSIYPMVPLTSVNTLVSSISSILAKPKSDSFGALSSVSKMFVSWNNPNRISGLVCKELQEARACYGSEAISRYTYKFQSTFSP